MIGRPNEPSFLRFEPTGSWLQPPIRKQSSAALIGWWLASLFLTLCLTGCLRPYSGSLLDPSPASFPGITSYWHQDSSANMQGSISIVAFTDPNDLLSYLIPPKDQAILGTGATLVNVITSNACALFGFVENLLPAHAAYNQSPDVLKLLFAGSQRELSE
jgi:hypothetical protein